MANLDPADKLVCKSVCQQDLGVFDAEKQETKIDIQKIEDIYQYAHDIEAVVSSYL